jgi:hypothetical protein
LSGQIGWWYDEFRVVFEEMAKTGSESAELSSLLRKLENCPETYKKATKADGHEGVDEPAVSLLVALTTTELQKHARPGSKFWRNGLLGRFALVTAPKDRPEEAPGGVYEGASAIPKHLTEPLQKLDQRLGEPGARLAIDLDYRGKVDNFLIKRGKLPCYSVTLSSEVKQAFQRYSSGLKSLLAYYQEELEDLKSNYTRLSGFALQLASLFTALDGLSIIAPRHFALAQQIAERRRQDLHELYKQTCIAYKSEEASEEERILRHVRRCKENQQEPPTPREIRQYTHLSRAVIRKHLHTFVCDGTLIELKSGRTTRYAFPPTEEEMADS